MALPPTITPLSSTCHVKVNGTPLKHTSTSSLVITACMVPASIIGVVTVVDQPLAFLEALTECLYLLLYGLLLLIVFKGGWALHQKYKLERGDFHDSTHTRGE